MSLDGIKGVLADKKLYNSIFIIQKILASISQLRACLKMDE